MTKRIAVLISDRQAEALRMSTGLMLLDDSIDIFLLDNELEQTEQNMLNIELLKEMDMNVYTNNPENGDMTYLPIQEITQKLAGYDHVYAY